MRMPPTRAMQLLIEHALRIHLYMYFYDVLSFSYLDWDSNHQLLASEDLVVSTRPSCHLTYCKNFTYINLKVALRIHRECAFSSVL